MALFYYLFSGVLGFGSGISLRRLLLARTPTAAGNTHAVVVENRGVHADVENGLPRFFHLQHRLLRRREGLCLGFGFCGGLLPAPRSREEDGEEEELLEKDVHVLD